MQAEGYYKGAGDETVAVANFTQWNSADHLRYEDEPARRKLLEFIVSSTFFPLYASPLLQTCNHCWTGNM